MSNFTKIIASVSIISFLITGCANTNNGASPKKIDNIVNIDTSSVKTKVITFPAVDLDGAEVSKSKIKKQLLEKFLKAYNYPKNQQTSKNIIFDIWTTTYNEFEGSLREDALVGIYKKNKQTKTITLGGTTNYDTYKPTTLTFKIPYTIIKNGNKYNITLIPPKNAIYVDNGVPLPSTIENLKADILRIYNSIGGIILYSNHTIKGELNSKYKVNAIYGNFKRKTSEIVLNKEYDMKLNGETYRLKIDAYPYRDGSKILYEAVILYAITKDGLSLSKEKVASVKKQIISIIND